MANDHFLRKLACDELHDTMYFASGEVPIKTYDKDTITLKTSMFETKIFSIRKILVNTHRCKNVPLAKLFIQENL